MSPAWRAYEDAARKVLTDLRQLLGLSAVEGKQTLAGLSGAQWEIDAKAWVQGSGGFLVIEVRRHTKSGLKQEEVAGIAFRIGDVSAQGGIVVSPMPLQKGARHVAQATGITHLRLSPESTTEDYLAEFMGRRFIGASVTESISAGDKCDAEVIRGNRTSDEKNA